jgi:SAM-dependent methyltransferase
MNFSRLIMVVAPGCPAGLIQEFVAGQLLPDQSNLEVLLPPGSQPPSPAVAGGPRPSGPLQFSISPARSFFSSAHLKWLREKLRTAGKIMMLIPGPLYHDSMSVLASLLVWALAGQTLTLQRVARDDEKEAAPAPTALPHGQDRPRQWVSFEINGKVVCREFRQLVWACYPGILQKFFTLTERELCYYFDAYETDPANFLPLDASPEAIERDVAYALGNADIWTGLLPGGAEFLKGKRVLEIGPGVNFGTTLALACHGAEVLVAERFPSPWDPDYHPKFYARLRDELAAGAPRVDLTPLNAIISQGRYPADRITIYQCSLEELSAVPSHSVDLIFSNAVFEHLYDLKAASAQIARITRPGGLGLHQVDFRDHRNPSRPLEYLLLSDREFKWEFKERHGECGNRFRPLEMRRFFEEAGFVVNEFRPDLYAEAEYLAEFLTRLRQARKSRYRHYRAEDIREISGLFVLEKRPG